MNLIDLIFMLSFLSMLGITLYRLYNIFNLTKCYDIKFVFIFFISFVLSWGINIINLMLSLNRTHATFFYFANLLLMLNVIFLFVEIAFAWTKKNSGFVESFKSNEQNGVLGVEK